MLAPLKAYSEDTLFADMALEHWRDPAPDSNIEEMPNSHKAYLKDTLSA